MRQDDFMNFVYFMLVLLFFAGLYSLSDWLDVPLLVVSKVCITQLFTLCLFLGIYFLQGKFDLSGKWFYPALGTIVYLGFTPLINYKSVPFHSNVIKYDPAFYGQGWFHFLIVLLILLVGYGLIFYKQKIRW